MSDDIVKKLREKPWRGGSENNDEAKIRRQKEREDGADLIEAQRKRIASLEAKVTKLKAEAKLWWDENIKKQTACEQMGKRITELEAALKRIEDTDPDEGTQWFHEVARAALERKDKQKRIFSGIGEIGIDPDASPGNGNWYVKLCDGSYDVVGFDCEEDAIQELVAAAIRAKFLEPSIMSSMSTKPMENMK